MSAVAILLTLSAIIGFALGRSLSWLAVGIAGFLLAVLSSAVLHKQGFGALSGIAIIVACLTINQVSYLASLLGVGRHSQEPIQKHADNKPSRRRNDYVGDEQQQQQRSTTVRGG
jgi:hypothetical protein